MHDCRHSEDVGVDCNFSPSVSIIGNRPVNENSSITLGCQLSTCSTSSCYYRWSASEAISGYTDKQNITLTNITRDWNAATLYCHVTAVNGLSYTIRSTTMNVQYGPSSANISVSSPWTLTENTSPPTAITCSSPVCNPSCNVKWFNGSTQILSTTLFSTAVRRYFAGFYTCNVSNAVGFWTVQLNLIVNYGPSEMSITPSEENQTLVEGASAQNIICSVWDYFPSCRVQWTLNNIVSQEKSVRGGRIDLLLFNRSVTRNDTNIYRCTAKNLESFIEIKREKTLNLTVLYGPDAVEITPTDATIRVVEGQSISVICTIRNCFKDCIMQWTRSSSIFVPSQSVTSLPLFSSMYKIDRQMSGTYVCIGTNRNSFKIVNNSMALDVQYGPSSATISVSSPLAVTENTSPPTAIICSNPVCNPSCTVQWFNGSTQILTTTLFSTPVSRYYAGSYTCNVSNAVGFRTKQLDLIVHYGPDTVDIAPTQSTIQVVEGYSIHLVCTIRSCFKDCNLKWTHSSGLTSPSQNVTSLSLFESTHTVNRQEAGIFVCTGTNMHTLKTANDTMTLDVLYAPDVTLHWDEGEKKFTCTAEGNPDNNTFHALEFRILGSPIRNISFQSGTGRSRYAVLKERSYQDKGTYTCTVENGILKNGAIKHSYTLEVVIKDVPILLEHIRTYNVSKGDPLNVTIPVYAFPAVPRTGIVIKMGDRIMSASDNITVNLENGTGLVFFHNLQITSEIQTLSVVINATQEEIFGHCIVTFTNAVGTTTAHFALFPQGPPDSPARFEQQSTTYNSVTFSVESGFFNGGDQTLVLQYRRVNSNSLWANGSVANAGKKKHVVVAMTVTDLSQVTDYEFRVYAFNVYGHSEYSALVQIATFLHVGMVVGSVTGGTAGVVLILVIMCAVYLKKKRDKKPPQTVTFTNILEEPKWQGHAEGNVYTECSSENIYMNTNATEIQASIDSNRCFKAKANSNDEADYMNVAKQLGKPNDDDMSEDDHVYDLAQMSIKTALEQGSININVPKKSSNTPSAAWYAKSVPIDKEEDVDSTMDAHRKPADQIYDNIRLTPGQTKLKKTKNIDEFEYDYVTLQ
ncbi:hemicentin-1-like [Dreissena polymorpha]|uniref:Uncharacterized protein n=1 Tax=Dreissena polymorpha TaxID=45954 RepID=A0A9D4LBY3_DREPO|nr:hemicentin-1-like [Dreissena polymorpha]KAH3854201.1 hypothetical protein DPMN_096740 [Dreissena polymorpha]